MKKRTFSKMAYAFIAMALVATGCDKDMENTVSDTDNGIEVVKVALQEVDILDNLTEEEMIARGWEVIGRHKAESNEETQMELKAAYENRTHLDMPMIKKMGYSENHIWNKGKSLGDGGTKADGFNINGKKYGKHPKGGVDLADKYNWYCYADMGRKSVTSTRPKQGGWKTLGSWWIKNHHNNWRDFNPNRPYYEESVSRTNNWHVSATTGVEWKNKINMFMAQSEITISVSVTAGGGGSKTVSKKYNLIPDGFPMAPRSKYNIRLQKRTATVRTTVKIPVSLSGKIGFNYPKKVKGHYFWGHPTTKVLDKKPGQEIIDVTEETNLEFQWVKGPKKPL